MHSPLFFMEKVFVFHNIDKCRVEYNSYLCGRILKLIRT